MGCLVGFRFGVLLLLYVHKSFKRETDTGVAIFSNEKLNVFIRCKYGNYMGPLRL